MRGRLGRYLIALVLGAGLCALLGAGLLWVFWDQALFAWWRWGAAGDLSVEEQVELAECRDPGWLGLLRVLEHDTELQCSDAWFATTAAAALTSDNRTMWFDRVARDPRLPARTRIRAGLALIEAGGEPIPGLGLVAADPAVSDQTRRDLVSAAVADDLPVAWMDPNLQREVALWRFVAGDLSEAPVAVARLRELVRDGDPTGRDALVDAALGAAELDRAWLAAVHARIEARLPLQAVPLDLVRLVEGRTGACTDPTSDACAVLAADVLERHVAEGPEGWGAGARGTANAGRLPRWLKEAWYAAHGRSEPGELSGELVLAVADWVAQGGDDRERAGRLLGVLAHPSHRYSAEVARAGAVGDPASALQYRRGSPWATAGAAVAIGGLAGVPVTVTSRDDGVVIEVGGRLAGLGRCGATVPVPTPEAPAGAPWSEGAVAAQVMLELVGAALRRGDRPAAVRLARLAERTDPVAAAGVVALVDHVSPPDATGDRAVGAHAAAALVTLDPSTPVGAEADRLAAARAVGDAAAAWTEPGEGCPSMLGP